MNNHLRVVIGLRQLFPGKIGGLETYVRGLLREWSQDDSGIEWVVLVNDEAAPSMQAFSGRMRIETVGTAHDPGLWQRAIKKHAPALYFSPLLTIDPPDVSLPTVVNIPDLQHIYYPAFFKREVLDFRMLHYPLSARRAEAILTLSEHAKSTIVGNLHVPASKVHAILLAPDDVYRQPATPEHLAAFLQSHDLPEKFGFLPANFWPHKNHQTLLRALVAYRRRFGTPPTIALSGFAGENAGVMAAQIQQLGLGDTVRILGYLPQEDLPVAYQAAGFLVFPSLFEGFGLPAAEAMASGCPVVCSKATSLPELVGDAAITFDAGDPDALAAALHQLLKDPEARQSLIERGRIRAAELTWRATATTTAAVLRSVWERLQAEPAPEIIPIPLRGDGRPQVEAIPVRQSITGLCFHPRNSPPDSATLNLAAQLLKGSGLSALIGSISVNNNTLITPAFDTFRLKSFDCLPIESLWVGPRGAQLITDRLQNDSDVLPYEIALLAATCGPVDNAPELLQAGQRSTSSNLGTRRGEGLSRRYFGTQDAIWLAAVGSAGAARLPLSSLLKSRTPRIYRGLASMIASLYRWHTVGQRPLFIRFLASLKPGSRPVPAPYADGWIGRQACFDLTVHGGQPLRLTIASPSWPLPMPPRIRVRINRTVVYETRLERRGTYSLNMPWPPEAGSRATITVDCDQTFIPAQHDGMGSDLRSLSVRILSD